MKESIRLLKRKTFYFLLGIFCLVGVMLASLYSSSSSIIEPYSQLPEEGALDFAVSLDKKSYKKDEPIEATFQLRNIGTNPVIVKGRLALNISSAPKEYLDFYCEITRNSEELIRFTASVSVVNLHSSHFVQLDSGDTIEAVYYDLRDLYRITDPGEYSIRAIYVNTFDPDTGQVAWKGEVVSKVETFVIEP